MAVLVTTAAALTAVVVVLTLSDDYRSKFRIFAVALLFALGLAVLIPWAANFLGIDGSASDFAASVAERTDIGGSRIDTMLVTSPLDIPRAAIGVLARPFPPEARTNAQRLVSLESLIILVSLVWVSPKVWRARQAFLREPYFLFSAVYYGGFVVMFSAISNLGILARQRTQLLPFLGAAIIGVAYAKLERSPTDDPERAAETPQQAIGGHD